MKMTARSCKFSTSANAETESNFKDRPQLFDTDIRWWINFAEIRIQTRRHRDHNRQHWEVYCDQQSDRFLKLTPLLQVSLVTRRYFASNASFRDVCGELIGMVQDRPVQSPLFISNLLLGAFRIFMIIQSRENHQKVQCSRRLTASSWPKVWPISIEFATSFAVHCW